MCDALVGTLVLAIINMKDSRATVRMDIGSLTGIRESPYTGSLSLEFTAGIRQGAAPGGQRGGAGGAPELGNPGSLCRRHSEAAGSSSCSLFISWTLPDSFIPGRWAILCGCLYNLGSFLMSVLIIKSLLFGVSIKAGHEPVFKDFLLCSVVSDSSCCTPCKVYLFACEYIRAHI